MEDEEEMAFDEEDDEGIEEDLDEDGTLGMDRLQVHTVDLGETAPGDDSTGNTRRAEVALPHPSLAPPPARYCPTCMTVKLLPYHIGSHASVPAGVCDDTLLLDAM